MLSDMSFVAMDSHELVRVETTKGIVDPPKALPFLTTLAGDIVLDESLCFASRNISLVHNLTILLG